tara:strand:+ start:1312 stop:2007 length:696 start_codon:yes stop_codon:yes gene_type:complete
VLLSKFKINLFLLVSCVFFISSGYSQPLASPKALGIDQQYFIKTGIGFKKFFGEYASSNKISINSDDNQDSQPGDELSDAIVGQVQLPQISHSSSVKIGVGSRIRNHIVAFEYGFAPILDDFHEFNVEYQYMFVFPQNIKPSMILGLDFHRFQTAQTALFSGKKSNAHFWGKGFHTGAGVHMSNKRFGWENRVLVRGLSIDNILAVDTRFQVSGLVMSWSLDLETTLYLYF